MPTRPDYKEIQAQQDEAAAPSSENRTNYPGSSYEDGVDAALRWVLGHTTDKPMEDD